MLPLGKIGFACFLAISMWFLCDGVFRSRRLIKIWLEVLFYTVLMTVVAYCFGCPVTVSEWIGSFLPLGGISHGFASTYIAMYMLLPVLLIVSRTLTLTQNLWVVLVLADLQVVTPILVALQITDSGIHPYQSEVTLFVLLFFVMRLIKHLDLDLKSARGVLLTVTILCWALLTTQAILNDGTFGSFGSAFQVLSSISADESSLLYLIAGTSLFLFTESFEPTSHELVNRVSGCTFGILLLHDHNVCRDYFWNKIIFFGGGMQAIWFLPGVEFVPAFMATVAIIFFVGVFVDTARQRSEYYVLESAVCKRIETKLDLIWSDWN